MPTDPEIFATLGEPIDEDTVKQLSSDLATALGMDHVLDSDGRGVIILVPKSEHCLLPEQLTLADSILEARLCTAYYGEGYERGDWPIIAATLEFLRRRLPTARVWYGPDGTDLVWEVTTELMERFWNYWARCGGRPYYEKWRHEQRDAPHDQPQQGSSLDQPG